MLKDNCNRFWNPQSSDKTTAVTIGRSAAWSKYYPISKNKVFFDGRVHDVTSEYDAFRSAKQRCENQTRKEYKDYGGRGILFKFNSFGQWLDALGLKPGVEYSVDRIDNDGHYEQGNVRWALPEVQAVNKRPRALVPVATAV